VGADFATAPVNQQLIVFQIVGLSTITGNIVRLKANPEQSEVSLSFQKQNCYHNPLLSGVQ